MTHTATIKGPEFWWTATLPDEIRLFQGSMSDADPNALFVLDGTNTVPLNIHFHYTPEVLFGQAHGILSFTIAEPADQDFFGTSQHYANTGNGLRGPITITFHNELGVHLQQPVSGLSGGGGTMAFFLGGVTDDYTQTTTFHAPYAHFHAPAGATLESIFYDADQVHGQVGPPFSGPIGNPSQAPDWILISGFPAQVNTYGPLTLHQRDLSPAADDFAFGVMLLDGALTPEDMAKVKAAYDAAHANEVQVMG
jgi:hypothetical protein